MNRNAPLLALLALAACAGLPRPTTPAERADLSEILATIETGLDLAKVDGKIPADHHKKAMQQVMVCGRRSLHRRRRQ